MVVPLPGLYAKGTSIMPPPGPPPGRATQGAPRPTMTPQEIETRIRAQLPDAIATVQSTDNVHFDAVIISPAFAGKRALHRHRLVYGCLGATVGGDIHALSIQAYTPEEWAARQG